MSSEVVDEEKGKPEEERDERAEALEREPQKPSTPVFSGALFARLAKVWVFVMAFFIAGFVYFLPASDSSFFLNKPVGFRLGSFEFTWMLAAAAAAFALTSWAVLKFFKSQLEYQKPGQGRWVRLTMYVAVTALSLFAAVTLHNAPSYRSGWWQELWGATVLGVPFALRPVFFPAAALFMAAVLAYHLFMNRPRWADFLTDTQGELRKVSWPPRREWVGSTIVVLVVMTFVSLFIFFVDVGLSWLVLKLRIGF